MIELVVCVCLFRFTSSSNCYASLVIRGNRNLQVKYYLYFRNSSRNYFNTNKLTLFTDNDEEVFPLVITCTAQRKASIQEINFTSTNSELQFHDDCCEMPLKRNYFKVFKTVFKNDRLSVVPVNFN